jgi:hypothetical protein
MGSVSRTRLQEKADFSKNVTNDASATKGHEKADYQSDSPLSSQYEIVESSMSSGKNESSSDIFSVWKLILRKSH